MNSLPTLLIIMLLQILIKTLNVAEITVKEFDPLEISNYVFCYEVTKLSVTLMDHVFLSS